MDVRVDLVADSIVEVLGAFPAYVTAIARAWTPSARAAELDAPVRQP